jgi:hypothetical protein
MEDEWKNNEQIKVRSRSDLIPVKLIRPDNEVCVICNVLFISIFYEQMNFGP